MAEKHFEISDNFPGQCKIFINLASTCAGSSA